MSRLFILFFYFPTISFAQYTEEEVVKFLTANAYKLWFFEQYKGVMGGSETCETGEAYIFHMKGKKVTHQKCINNRWNKNEYTWKLEKETEYDWWIIFNDSKYYLVMSDFPSYELLKLRKTGDPVSKTSDARDIILKFLKDD